MYTNVRVSALKCKTCKESLIIFEHVFDTTNMFTSDYQIEYYTVDNKDLYCPDCGSFVSEGIKIEQI